VKILIAGDIERLELRQRGHDTVDGGDNIGAGLLKDDQEHAALTIGPGCLCRVLRPADRGTDIAYAKWPIVPIGDNDIVPGPRLRKLIVGVNRVGTCRAVECSFWTVGRRDGERDPHVLERQAFCHKLGRIELNADRGLLLPTDRYLCHAGNLTDLRDELGLDVVVNLGQRQGL
jgi:hypothetical protein